MKNSCRKYMVNGTSALKYEIPAARSYSNIVDFPARPRTTVHHSSSLRIQRQPREHTRQEKIDVVLGFLFCSALWFGTIFSMI